MSDGSKEVRKLPEQEARVETGPIQFGEDWPGIFIRGDHCFRFAHNLRHFMYSPTSIFGRHAAEHLLRLLGEANLNDEIASVFTPPPKNPAESPAPPVREPKDDNRCAVCGWKLAESKEKGCVRGNCSSRPFPTYVYDAERANREYGLPGKFIEAPRVQLVLRVSRQDIGADELSEAPMTQSIHQRVAERTIRAVADCLVHNIHKYAPETCTGCMASTELAAAILAEEYGPLIEIAQSFAGAEVEVLPDGVQSRLRYIREKLTTDKTAHHWKDDIEYLLDWVDVLSSNSANVRQALCAELSKKGLI